MRRSTSRLETRPFLEHLEDRLTPSITVSGTTLTITGDGQADTITATTNGQGAVFATLQSVKGNEDLSATGIAEIVVNGGAGQDTVNIKSTGALTASLDLELHLGQNADTATMNFANGITGGTLAVDADGSVASDQFYAVFGTLTNANVDYENCLGSAPGRTTIFFGGTIAQSTVDVTVMAPGADNVAQVFAGDISGSQVTVADHLGAGNSSDSLAFAGITGASVVHTDIDASSGNDTIQESFGAITDSTLQVEDNLGTGNVNFQAQFVGNITDHSNVYFTIAGSGSDTLAVTATNSSPTAGVTIDGTSAVNISLDALQSTGPENMAVNYDGVLDGRLVVAERGGSGTDTLAENLTTEAGSTGAIVVRVNGDEGTLGNDTLTLNVINESHDVAMDARILAVDGDTVIHTPNVRVIWTP